MAEAIDDDVNNSNNKSNIASAAVTVTIAVAPANAVPAAAAAAAAATNDSGNGDMPFMANNRNTTNNCNLNNNPNSRRSMQRFSCSRCCNDLFNYLMRFRASPEELEQRHKSREIDRLLEKDKHTFRRQVYNFSQSL